MDDSAFRELVKENPDSIHPILDSPQQRFVASTVREVGYGGEAGGAKSFGLVLCPLYQLHKDNFHAILFRRTYKQLSGDDGLIDLSRQVYPLIGGRYIKSEYRWHFSGYPGTIRFAHIEHENVLEQDYEGHQYAFIGFDELQTFSERMYLYMFSRNRCTNPDVELFTRSTFMPGGIGHPFVKKRFIEPFLNGNGKPKHFTRIDNRDTEVSSDNRDAIQRTFIPAKLQDNPYLWRGGDSDYERGLRQLESVDYARKKGDWDIRRTGRVYHGFADKNIGPDRRGLDYDKVAGYYHSHDFGAVNHVWGLWAKIGKQYFLIYETKLPEGTTAARAKLIKAVFTKATRHFVDETLSLDPDVKIEDAVKMAMSKVVAGYGGSKGEKQNRLDFGREGVIIREPSLSNLAEASSVKAQIDQANTMLDNKMLDGGEMMICSNCVHSLDQLENCVHDEDEGIEDKATWHYLDMIRYFAAGIKRGVLIG